MGHKTNGNLEPGDKKEHIPLLPLKKAIKKQKLKSCILVVGTTGTGKTSTINVYTGNDLPVGDDAHAVTGVTTKVEDKIHSDSPIWIDSPGWEDPEGKSNATVFKKLLKFMQENELYWVKAVVWCMLPQPRVDQVLQAQARFIDMFTIEGERGKIWSNVLILSKGKLSKTAAEDCQGAVMAAKKVCVTAKPETLGYEFATDEVIEGTTETLRKDTLRTLTEDERRLKLEEVLEKMPPCLQVVFANQQCQSCGQTGDSRLMEDICHRNKVRGHTGELDQRFSKTQVGVACGLGAVGIVGLSTAAILVPSELVLLGLPMVMGPGTIMSGHRFLNSSSTSQPQCGPIKITDMRYKCCDMQELQEGGCTDKCDKCFSVWGTPGPRPPGCVYIKHPDSGLQSTRKDYEVAVKEHDLVDIVKS